MKGKRLFGILLSFMLMMTMMPAMSMTTYADDADDVSDYGLWVGGKAVTIENAGDVFGDGKVSYNPNEKTLTLKNYTYSGAGYAFDTDYQGKVYSAAIFSDQDLTIQLIGTNTTNATGEGKRFGVFIEGKDLTINGSGTLNINTANCGIDISPTYGLGNLTVNGGTVNATGENFGIYSGDVTINGGTVTAIGTDDDNGDNGVGLGVKNGITINSGTLTANGVTSGICNYSIGSIIINGGTVNANASRSTGIHFDEVTINGGALTANGGSHGIQSLELTVNGGALTANGDTSGIDSRDVTVNDGTLTASGGGSSGIKSLEVTVNGGALTASGASEAVWGSVKNYITGTGWTDAEGTTGKAKIDINTEGRRLEDFKKVQFPEAVDKVTVTFDSAGGSSVASQTIEKAGKATKPADPTRSGYIFDGWYNGNTAFDFSTAVNENITLTAHWKKNEIVPVVTTTAKTSARSMKVKWSWDKVNGAKKYKVAYRKVGNNKWKVKSTKKTKYVVKGHKLKGLYEYKVAAVTASGDVWSNVNRRYFKRVQAKAKVSKGNIKLSWKKDKDANGYEVWIATNKKMKNAQKFKVASSVKSYTFSNINKGKYYVGVRPLKTHGGVTYKGILRKAHKVSIK